MIAPVGIAFLFILEVSFMLWRVGQQLLSCRRNFRAFETSFEAAYPRFRHVSHALGHGLPLIGVLSALLAVYGNDLQA